MKLEKCDTCDGTGYIEQDRCHVCHYSKSHPGFKAVYPKTITLTQDDLYEIFRKAHKLADEKYEGSYGMIQLKGAIMKVMFPEYKW